MTMDLPADARARLDAHLDAVEQALAASGRSREQRRAIVDDLETQIIDMLAAKSTTPTLADLEAILAKLDPPGAYADPSAAPSIVLTTPAPVPVSIRPRSSWTTFVGFICILVSALSVPLVLVGLMFTSSDVSYSSTGQDSIEPPEQVIALTPDKGQPALPPSSVPRRLAAVPPPRETVPVVRTVQHSSGWSSLSMLGGVAVLIVPLALIGTVLGWVAFGQIRRSKGALKGIELALFDGLFYPVIFVMILAFRLAHFL